MLQAGVFQHLVHQTGVALAVLERDDAVLSSMRQVIPLMVK